MTPTRPHPSEWSLYLKIMCMHFILSSHDISSHICNHICQKICNIKSKNKGGGSKAVWNFSKNSSDLVARHFPYLCHNCITSITWFTRYLKIHNHSLLLTTWNQEMLAHLKRFWVFIQGSQINREQKSLHNLILQCKWAQLHHDDWQEITKIGNH